MASEPTPIRPSRMAIVTSYMLSVTTIVTMLGILWLIAPMIYARYAGPSITITPTAAAGNVGGQAPPSVRGSYSESTPAIAATPIPGIAQSADEAQRMYEATAQASISGPISATPIPFVSIAPDRAAPLPLNSAGQPVIDETQQQQLDFSAQMAADEQQAALRAAQLADAASRAPDVSYADAAQLLHRDPCHVPRADPATCARGLFKPTPVQP